MNEIIFDKNLVDENKIKISIVGDGNKIIFEGKVNFQRSLSINIKADGNNIVIGKDITINGEVGIFILPAGSGSPSLNNSVHIDEGCFFNGACNLILAESSNSINIGKNCLFSSGITFNTSDSHSVFLLEGGGSIE